MTDEVKKTVRKLPAKLFAFVGYTKDEAGNVTLDSKFEIHAGLDEVLDKLQDPAYMATHRMYTLTHDDLYR